jgi:putative transposase
MDCKKQKAINATLAETRRRRKDQTAKSYTLKLDKSHLGAKRQVLERLFLEAKWLTNYALENGLKVDCRLKTVGVKVGSHFEERVINLPSQVRQELLDRMRDDLRSLHAKKVKGYKVGRLRFKRTVNSIPLKQYGITYLILGNRVRLQGVGWLRVNGVGQIPADAEPASATLVRRHGDYYLHVNTFVARESNKNGLAVGTDFGIKNQATFSNGVRVNYGVPLPKRLKGLCKSLSRKKGSKKGERKSKNWLKALAKVQEAYEAHTNLKRDIRGKMFHFLKENYQYVAFQNDYIAGWQRLWGRRILESSIGGLRSTFSRVDTPIEVPRFYPSTKTCSCCGHVQQVSLDERVFKCEKCGLEIDRDLNSANNDLAEGLWSVGITPVEKETSTRMLEYFNSIPGVRASLIREAGSLTALA